MGWRSRNTLLLLTFYITASFSYAVGIDAQGLQGCCDGVSNDILCYNACREALSMSMDESFWTSSGAQSISSACSSSYVQFWGCLNQSSITIETDPPTPAYYYCCDQASTQQCMDACKQHLLLTDFQDAIPLLTPVCGPLHELGPVWTCLYQHPTSTEAPTSPEKLLQPQGVDWARVQCCYLAAAVECQDTCLQLHSSQISSQTWHTFQLDCIHRQSESTMATCLADVAAPCKLGCSGLQYCKNFNNRPTDSFRNCNSAAERMAKNTYYSWANTGIILHPLITISVNSIQRCHPEMWKAVACITYVQPCHPTTHTTQICREDCITLLRDCSNSTFAPEAVCDIIAPSSSSTNCISISKYLLPSTHRTSEVAIVTNPCDPNPCAQGFFCSINHMCQSEEQFACSPYSCKPGCTFRDAPNFVFPAGSAVRVSLVANNKGCYGYFNCSPPSSPRLSPTVGYLSDGSSTQPLMRHCEDNTGCTLKGVTYAHQFSFTQGCNFCSCSHGRLICTNHTCTTAATGEVASYVNCSCQREYLPVCSKDGRTIPNPCIAHCLGYSPQDYIMGSCSSVDQCSSSICEAGFRCLPKRHVCLSNGTGEKCEQFSCVPVMQVCSGESVPVCDSSNNQHPNLCAFLRTQEEFGYFGYCKTECSRSKSLPVCGMNGETYESHCQAEYLRIAVDYSGPCTAIPVSASDGISCPGVICPPLPHPGCTGVTSRDACCRKCGAHLTILIDKNHLHRNINALGKTALSSTDIVERLRHHISSLQCDLYGHVSLDGSLSVLVLPTVNSSAPVMIEACNQEAIKLSTFINNRTPLLSSDPVLSHLVAAFVNTSRIEPVRVATEPIGPEVTSRSPDHLSSGSQASVSVLMVILLSFANYFFFRALR